jgi:hypothetical protein
LLNYIGSQKKRSYSIASLSVITLARDLATDKGVYRIFEETTPDDYATVSWDGSSFSLVSLPDSKFRRQDISLSNKICIYVDSLDSTLKIKNNYSSIKKIITWLEN